MPASALTLSCREWCFPPGAWGILSSVAGALVDKEYTPFRIRKGSFSSFAVSHQFVHGVGIPLMSHLTRLNPLSKRSPAHPPARGKSRGHECSK